jgi:hypothetical protein
MVAAQRRRPQHAEFKKEFEAFVNEMREYGPLRNGRAMYDYCYSNAEKMDGGMGNSFGFIAESENYRYCFVAHLVRATTHTSISTTSANRS